MTPHSSVPTTSYSRRSVLRLGGGAALAIVLAACGNNGEDDDPPEEESGSSDPVTSFTIVAEDMEWNLERVIVPAGTEIAATVENRDNDMPHNLHVKSPGDPKSELESGPVTQTLRFTIDEPGRYEFVCDIHSNMTGTIEAV